MVLRQLVHVARTKPLAERAAETSMKYMGQHTVGRNERPLPQVGPQRRDLLACFGEFGVVHRDPDHHDPLMADFVPFENPILVHTRDTDYIAFVGEAVFANKGDPVLRCVLGRAFGYFGRCCTATPAILKLKILKFRYFIVLFQVIVLKCLVREVCIAVMPEYGFWRLDFLLTQPVESVARDIGKERELFRRRLVDGFLVPRQRVSFQISIGVPPRSVR